MKLILMFVLFPILIWGQKTTQAIFDNYVGKYGNVEIIKSDEKLYYNNTEMELLPESKTKFFRADNNDRTIEFIQDKSGICNALILTKGGVKEIITKNKP